MREKTYQPRRGPATAGNWRVMLLCVVFACVFRFPINMTASADAGSLDATFGIGGKVTTDLGLAVTDVGQAAAIQTDGKIVVAGSGCAGAGPCQDIVAVSYNANGTLDSSFGSGGRPRLGLAPQRLPSHFRATARSS